jgi:SSS family solute:Na+ symporter
MDYLSIDHLIVYAFLLITLGVGLWASRGIKDIREYAIANKRYGTGVLTMTILATYITGSQGIDYVGYVFEDGILPVISIYFCGAVITFLFIAWYIAPNIHYFTGCLTLGEVMGKLYGRRARFGISILGIGYSIAIVALQIVWLAYIGDLFNIPGPLSIILGSLLLIVYAARGGMKAIAVTDLVQFLAIAVFVPLVAYVILYKVGGIKAVFANTPRTAFDVLHHPSSKDYIIYSIWDLFPAFPLSFPFIQRMLMARNKQELVNSQYLVIAFLTIFYTLLTLIGLGAIVLKMTGDVTMPQQGSKVFVFLLKLTYL